MISRVPRVRAAVVEPVGDSAVIEQGRPRAPASTPVLPGRRWRRQRHRHPRRRPDRAAARSRETAHQVAELRPRVSRILVFRPPGKPQPPGQVLVAPLAVVGHRVERAAGSVVEHGSVRPDEGQVEVLVERPFSRVPNCAKFTTSMSSGRFIAPVTVVGAGRGRYRLPVECQDLQFAWSW